MPTYSQFRVGVTWKLRMRSAISQCPIIVFFFIIIITDARLQLENVLKANSKEFNLIRKTNSAMRAKTSIQQEKQANGITEDNVNGLQPAVVVIDCSCC